MAAATTTKMQSFHANDNVKLEYIDTGVDSEEGRAKPWLILVSGVSVFVILVVWIRFCFLFHSGFGFLVGDVRGCEDGGGCRWRGNCKCKMRTIQGSI
jgi:hypothetical protein